jgi:hypothetical protein
MSKTQTVQKETHVSIKIKKLDVAESYFFGVAEFEGQEYKINIQGHWQEKLIKLPFRLTKREKFLVNLTGTNESFVDDILFYKGKSEWIEIDSQHILYYIADHQDEIDTLEIFV